jgi:hypothetical protein
MTTLDSRQFLRTRGRFGRDFRGGIRSGFSFLLKHGQQLFQADTLNANPIVQDALLRFLQA